MHLISLPVAYFQQRASSAYGRVPRARQACELPHTIAQDSPNAKNIRHDHFGKILLRQSSNRKERSVPGRPHIGRSSHCVLRRLMRLGRGSLIWPGTKSSCLLLTNPARAQHVTVNEQNLCFLQWNTFNKCTAHEGTPKISSDHGGGGRSSMTGVTDTSAHTCCPRQS